MEPRRKLFAICHLFRSRVERTDEVKFDFLPSCANIDVSRMPLSVPSGERESKVKGRRRKAARVSVSRFNASRFYEFLVRQILTLYSTFRAFSRKLYERRFLRVCLCETHENSKRYGFREAAHVIAITF